ncbi:MAG: MBL fold metallo-hydrolase [Sandaracinaceae bacterium]|nr:MBL fold metallo-hydrolase [Sandaracinaceae bacterium]
MITAIDVGQGDCTLLECPNGAEVLVDCGSSAAGDRDRVAALLDEHIDGELEVLVVTHPDADHINFLAPTADGSVLGEREIGRALLSLDEAAYRETETGERLMDWLDMRGADVHFLTPSDASTQDQPSSLFECGDTEVYILAASEPSASHDRALQRNTPSIVLLVERTTGGRRFRAMLTGDATRETEAAILARYPPAFLDVDLLKVGHHGALTSTVDPNDPSWRWLAATTPRHALTTAGHHGDRPFAGEPRRTKRDRGRGLVGGWPESTARCGLASDLWHAEKLRSNDYATRRTVRTSSRSISSSRSSSVRSVKAQPHARAGLSIALTRRSATMPESVGPSPTITVTRPTSSGRCAHKCSSS